MASHCCPSLQIIKAQVDDNALEAIRAICKACPNLRSLSLCNDHFETKGDEIIQTLVQHCPFIETMSSSISEPWELTDAGLDALATIHNLKNLELYAYDCTSAAIQRVLQSNPQLTFLHVYREAIDDALVRCIGRCCGHLTSLQLSLDSSGPSFVSLNNACLIDLFRGCPLLEVFHLRHRRKDVQRRFESSV